MDGILALVAEWWWIAPAAGGAGAIGWAGVRRGRPSQRRLELDASRLDLREAQEGVIRSRALLKVARAELLRAQADKTASRAPAGAVGEARRRVHQAERDARAAVAELKARRAGVHAAKAMLPRGRVDPDDLPVARLMAEHDRLTARWMEYETDPARAIGFPAMTDARWPPIELFLRELQRASWLRPPARDSRMAPADFAAYRRAVRRATDAFEAAERAARRGAPDDPGADTERSWSEIAQGLIDNANRAIARSTEAWNRARDRRRPPET